MKESLLVGGGSPSRNSRNLLRISSEAVFQDSSASVFHGFWRDVTLSREPYFQEPSRKETFYCIRVRNSKRSGLVPCGEGRAFVWPLKTKSVGSWNSRTDEKNRKDRAFHLRRHAEMGNNSQGENEM